MISLLGASGSSYSQATDLLLEDPEDLKMLLDEFPADEGPDNALNSIEESGDEDDLDSLKDDLSEIEFSLPDEQLDELDQIEKVENLRDLENDELKATKNTIKILKEGDIAGKEDSIILEVGKLEKDLLELASEMQGKIPNSEWNDIAGASVKGTYEIVKGDWLWKISKKIFGSGFYYSKIWALNPYITNPHEIEPGMILSFSTGSDNNLPALEIQKARKNTIQKMNLADNEYDKWGDSVKPAWLEEREKKIKDGVFIQYSTADTREDLDEIGNQFLIKEYEVYEPPRLDFAITVPEDEFDTSGFDKNSKIAYNFKEGFPLTTFISNNVVQDFGKVSASFDEKILFSTHDYIFIEFDEKMDVTIGDKYSFYRNVGQVSHKNSDRKGFEYTITGAFEVLEKKDNLWKCIIKETTGYIERGTRVTTYTPKIERITKTYNPRLIEAVLIGSFQNSQKYLGFGDIAYLDRGRADGVEVGNILEVYGFKDRATWKNITKNPAYRNGELTVLSVTDNFSTVIVSNMNRDFIIGDISVTKTKEAAARETKLKLSINSGKIERIKAESLDELDIELNISDLNDSLLDKADKIQFTEDELAELERQEREKSILSENEKDLRSLERLETELETAEKMLNESRLDEDKLLEAENLESIEKNFGIEQQESLDEIEENFGKRFLDEDLNDKENPYGLTEFDIEEIDELLNSEKEAKQ
jgi:hypothetical protein